MSSLTLGASPVGLTMWLIDAAPFAASVTATVPFPSPPELLFSDGTTWPGTLDDEGTTAAWVRTAAEVAALVESSPRRATLRDPDSHHVWAHGTVYVTRVNESGTSDALPPGGSITVDNLDGALHITYVVGSGGGGAVDSVNGQTGAVVLDASDVGALPDTTPIPAAPGDIGAQPAGDYATTTALTEGLSGKADAAHTHTPASIGAATAGQGGLADSAVQPGDDAATLGSGSATSGRVLTADGSGATSWQESGSGGGGGGGMVQSTPAVGTYFLSPWLTGGSIDKPVSVLEGYAFVPVPSPMTIDTISIYVHTGQAGATGGVEVYAVTAGLGVGALVTTLTGADLSTSGRKEFTWSHAATGPGLFFLATSTVGSVRLLCAAPVGPGAGIGNASPTQTMPAAVGQYPGAITSSTTPRTSSYVPMVMLRRSA